MHALTAAQQSWRLPQPQNELLSETDRKFCAAVGQIAVRSLYSELVLYPKPGLVSLIDSGSHKDMNAGTFMRSLFALRHYFIRIARAGFEDASFDSLRQLGIEAEQRMLQATSGINTHRGAIFCIGMLCATVGRCRAQRISLLPEEIRAALLIRWGQDLKAHAQSGNTQSHGQHVARKYAVSGAREEVALGLPSVFDIALPALRTALDAGREVHIARIDALFSLMAHVNDTNVYFRRGASGADLVRACARQFLEQGGTAHSSWKATALAYHQQFIENNLSPGGAADLLAATCFIHDIASHSKKMTMKDIA